MSTATTLKRPLADAQRRTELRRPGTAPGSYAPLVNAAAQAKISSSGTALEGSFVAISYLERAPVRVQGLTSGRTYQFSASDPVCEVDVRDAFALLNTRYFRRA
jgi:hypothetical protein